MTEQEMMEEAREWGEHIARLASQKKEDHEFFQKRMKVFNWLLKQAERAMEE